MINVWLSSLKMYHNFPWPLLNIFHAIKTLSFANESNTIFVESENLNYSFDSKEKKI